MTKLVLLGLLAASAMAVPMPDSNNLLANRDLDCLEQEDALFSCMFVKAISTLNRAARSGDFEIFDGINFVRETAMARSDKDLKKTELDIMNELPRDASERAVELVNMLYQSAMSFIKSHSLKLSMPEDTSISRALDEGRGKLKKMILPIVAAVAVKLFALVPILLGSLGLLVVKALFVGKLALLVAGVLAFQRLFGASSKGQANIFSKNAQPAWIDNGSQGWSSGGVAQQQGYYKRSFEHEKDAHDMAYAAQAPTTNEAH